jgi:hypothetical protein
MNCQVLEVKAKKRTGSLNYMLCLRQALANHYGSQPVGLGGTFLMEKGKAEIHIMVSVFDIGHCIVHSSSNFQPDFSEVPLESDEAVHQWLKYYEMEGPMVFVGYIISHDPVGLTSPLFLSNSLSMNCCTELRLAS